MVITLLLLSNSKIILIRVENIEGWLLKIYIYIVSFGCVKFHLPVGHSGFLNFISE